MHLPKNKNIVKANFPWTYSVRIDHSRWRQESIIRSLNTQLSQLWLEIVSEIMSLLGLCWGLRVTDTMLVTYLVISGSSGMLWLCPRHRHCLHCLHCQCQLSAASSAPVPRSSLSLLPSRCLLFITFFWPYFVAGVSFFLWSSLRFVQLLTPAPLCLLSQPRSDSWLCLCVTVLIRSRSWAQTILTQTTRSPPVLLGCTLVSLLSSSFCHRSNPGRVGLDMDAPAARSHCYSDEGRMEAKGSSPRML